MANEITGRKPRGGQGASGAAADNRIDPQALADNLLDKLEPGELAELLVAVTDCPAELAEALERVVEIKVGADYLTLQNESFNLGQYVRVMALRRQKARG